MVLGGLLKDEFGDGEDRVPFLGDLPPLVGNLFRTDSRTGQENQPDGLPAPGRDADAGRMPPR